MKKIVLISLHTPTLNNVRAASALPYHLIKGGKECENVDFDIFSFNINNIDEQGIEQSENELGVNIHLLRQPLWIRYLFRWHLLFLRILLRYPLLSYLRINKNELNKIKGGNHDAIWIYGEELAGLADSFRGEPITVTMPDCESLYYHRLLSKRFATKSLYQILRYAYAYWQYRGMERQWFRTNVKYHFVGQEDAVFYKDINPEAEAQFVRHPLYEYRAKPNIHFHSPQLKILIAGRNDIYMKEDTDALIRTLVHADVILKEKLCFTFLGKGWEQDVEMLKDSGIEATHISFVKDYIDELQKHDIQITPISVGTGTKGKVLDAIANGLLVVGTYGALENIAVVDRESCIVYKDPEEVVVLLKDMIVNPSKYEDMAMRGSEQVKRYHQQAMIAQQVFGLGIGK